MHHDEEKSTADPMTVQQWHQRTKKGDQLSSRIGQIRPKPLVFGLIDFLEETLLSAHFVPATFHFPFV